MPITNHLERQKRRMRMAERARSRFQEPLGGPERGLDERLNLSLNLLAGDEAVDEMLGHSTHAVGGAQQGAQGRSTADVFVACVGVGQQSRLDVPRVLVSKVQQGRERRVQVSCNTGISARGN